MDTEGWTCADGIFVESFWEKPLELHNAPYMTDFPKCCMENFSLEGGAGGDLLTKPVLCKDEAVSSWGSIPPAASQGCTGRKETVRWCFLLSCFPSAVKLGSAFIDVKESQQ